MLAHDAGARANQTCAQPLAATAARLRDGARVTLRDAHDDGQRLREMFFTLTDTTRYLYFCAGVPRNDVWAERVAQLGAADGCDSYAMVAEVGGALVGVARFDRAADGMRAEIGILLADAWQSRGLGTAVVARLRAEAARLAVSGFTATVLGENYRALRLLRRAFPAMRTTWSHGQGALDLPFDDVPISQEEVINYASQHRA